MYLFKFHRRLVILGILAGIPLLQTLQAAAADTGARRSHAAERPRAAAGGPASTGGLLAVPTEISSGQTVRLMCGKTYVGTLNLSGKYNVRVQTEGDCGPAAISPGRPVIGWARYKDNIWTAPADFEPKQIALAGKPLELAHYPNRPQVWAKGKSSGASRILHALPNADIAGAQLVFRANEWLIEKRRVDGYAGGAIELGPRTGEPFDPPAEVEFYVEGKLWMLDAPGEWAYSNGRLFVWTPDGQTPEGRIWASPNAPGINAADSREVTIDGVKVFSATIGIDGSNSSNLRILNTEISNSAEDGIFAGGSGLIVDNARISNSVQNGIYGFYNITNSTIANSTIVNTGMVGMPKRSKGGIAFELASGQRVVNNTVLNSSYIGIRVHKNAIVSGNTVDGACLILTDCGGIYTFAPDKQPLNVRIEGNTVRNLAQRQAYAIYLDDNANGVTVSGNTLSSNPGGIEIHNGFNNVIAQNVFSASRYEHILMNETTPGPSVHQNQFIRNTYISSKGVPVYRLWSHMGGANVSRFGFYDHNIYMGGTDDFAEVAGSGMVSYSRWRGKMGQDGQSQTRAAPGRGAG